MTSSSSSTAAAPNAVGSERWLKLFRALRSGLRPHTRSGGYAADLIGRYALTQDALDCVMSSLAANSPLKAARLIAADVKLHHSVFAMPFAVLAAFMAAAPAAGGAIDWSRFAGQLVLVVLAMVFGRTVAMVANRVLDRELDRENPRTAGRALPSGRLTVSAAVNALLLAAGGFMVVCLAFGIFYGNWWPTILGLGVLAWLVVYPLLKRFTWLCHLYLGASLAMSPLAAALAVKPASLTEVPALWLLAAMVMGWVAGFDIIYALQDVDVDRRLGHFSIPSRLGVSAALWVSRGGHGAAAGSLVAAAWLEPRLGLLVAAAGALVRGLLVYEHLTVTRWGTTRMALAFFTLNGLISVVLGLLGVGDILFRQ